MLPEDERRLRREADIANAVRGPDYTKRDKNVAAVKAELRQRDASAMAKWQVEYAGYQGAVLRGEVQRDDTGAPYPFRPAPGSREH